MFICRKGHKNTYMKIITRISTPTEKLLLNSLCIAAWAPVTSIWWKGGWESSQHFATLPMVSLDNEVWWHVTSLIWIVLLIERSKFPMLHDQYQKNYSVLDSDMSAVWNLFTVPQISLFRETSGGVVECWLFSEGNEKLPLITFDLGQWCDKVGLQHTIKQI